MMAPNPMQYSQQQAAAFPLIQAAALGHPQPVHIKTLPFYEHHAALIPPSPLQSTQRGGRFQENQFHFVLSLQQANDIASNRDIRDTKNLVYIYQVQLRFCPMDTTKEQTDEFPPSICVQVNGKMCTLPNPIPTNKPNVEPKRPPKPIDLSPLLKLSPTITNTVNVKWAADNGKGWAIFINFVEKLDSKQLLEKLVKKGTRESQFTRELIKKKLCDDGDDIAMTNLKVTVACPLGKMRMSAPCRPTTCDHLQCFDANLFLQMNEKKPTWQCPVCDSPALFQNLMVDGYFLDVIKANELPEDENEIILNQDGSWHPVPKDDSDEANKKDDDDDDYGPSMRTSGVAPVAAQPPAEVECIDID